MLAKSCGIGSKNTRISPKSARITNDNNGDKHMATEQRTAAHEAPFIDAIVRFSTVIRK